MNMSLQISHYNSHNNNIYLLIRACIFEKSFFEINLLANTYIYTLTQSNELKYNKKIKKNSKF